MEVQTSSNLKRMFSYSNIILFLLLALLLYLTYQFSYLTKQEYVELPTVDITKRLTSIEESNKVIMDRTEVFDFKLDSISSNIKNSKSTVTNIYKSQEHEKEIILSASDSANYNYFIEYVDKFNSAN